MWRVFCKCKIADSAGCPKFCRLFLPLDPAAYSLLPCVDIQKNFLDIDEMSIVLLGTNILMCPDAVCDDLTLPG
jgi:hypothetical protein